MDKKLLLTEQEFQYISVEWINKIIELSLTKNIEQIKLFILTTKSFQKNFKKMSPNPDYQKFLEKTVEETKKSMESIDDK